MSLQSVGQSGEHIAQNYLLSSGYAIRECNFRSKLGEIDIVAEKGEILYFCEVKTRVGDVHGKPYEAVTRTKLKHMYRAAQAYLLHTHIKNSKLSLQVISIELFHDHSLNRIKMYEVI